MSEIHWRTSTYSDDIDCVEVALLPHATLIRDSKNPHGGHLTIPTAQWHDFLAQLHRG